MSIQGDNFAPVRKRADAQIRDPVTVSVTYTRSTVEPALTYERFRGRTWVSVYVPYGWLHRVYKTGHAIIDGRLVIAIDGDTATVVAQYKGGSLRLVKVSL